MKELERGIDEGSQGSLISELTKHPLGIHWTDNPETSAYFAQPHKYDEDRLPVSHPLSETQFATIIHGRVASKNIVKEDSPEWKSLAKTHHIYGHDAEDEITVRPNAKVKVVGLERKKHSTSGKERTRMVRFNPPRELKA